MTSAASLSCTRPPKAAPTHQTNDEMDTLRFIPESLSAARTTIQDVVRELVGGKVEISYVRADRTITPAPSPTTVVAPTSTDASLPHDKMPSPWGFMTSGYALGLLLMAILLNRIAHVVVPPRQSNNRRRRWNGLLPINISATHTRLVSRAPSIGLLATALFLLTIALVQSAGIWEPLAMAPDSRWTDMWYIRACRWAAEKEMAYVCWWTYIAVCVAMVVNTLTKGLEGAASDGPHSFNLFGYSFLLHIYASPIMHSQAPKQPLPTDHAPPSRPDKHVLLTIILPLLQLTILHVLAVNKRWSRQRLIPTTICGLLSIIHFAYVTLFSSSTYPFFTYLNSLLEAFLVGIILLTCVLHFITRALLEGRFSLNPFSEQDGLAHQSLLPSRSDDYAVALLKLGSVCIEATAMAGFGNEVSPIHTPETLYITHTGVPSIPAPRGLAREIKSVHAVEHVGSTSAWFDMHWTREVGKFGQRIGRVGKGVWRAIWYGRQRCDENERAVVVRERPDVDMDEVYARYLLGQATLSDDEDDEFRAESDSESEVGSDESADEDEDVSAPTLYADLARRSLAPPSRSPSPGATSSALTPMLIAHLTSPAHAPLTRHRYTQLARPEPDLPWLNQTRPLAIGPEDEDPRRNCVVCTVEPRAVICWPCRCLALCDDCRSNLASRMGAGKHQCPCCRRTVEGYSRIFIP